LRKKGLTETTKGNQEVKKTTTADATAITAYTTGKAT
jgi:hypothetical protein